MEIFCFLHMGGSLDRVIVVPVVDDGVEVATEAQRLKEVPNCHLIAI